MTVSDAVSAMVHRPGETRQDINHLLKVWGFARNIGILEDLDEDTLLTLEMAAVVHDIACPFCREKYGCADGYLQERESEPLVRAFFSDSDLSQKRIDRIVYLVTHHHTIAGAEGMDYHILLEADMLVNADEGKMPKEAVRKAREAFFRTRTGTFLLNSMYELE